VVVAKRSTLANSPTKNPRAERDSGIQRELEEAENVVKFFVKFYVNYLINKN
jgi:hypothetical protein